MAKSAKPLITNVHVDCVSRDRGGASAGFDYAGARYHLWFDVEDRKFEGHGSLYKNPPLGVARDSGEDFQTRALNPLAAKNRPLVEEMWRRIDEGKLIEAAIAEADEKDRRAAEQLAEQARINRIQRHGLALFEQLKLALPYVERVANAWPADEALMRKREEAAELAAVIKRELAAAESADEHADDEAAE